MGKVILLSVLIFFVNTQVFSIWTDEKHERYEGYSSKSDYYRDELYSMCNNGDLETCNDLRHMNDKADNYFRKGEKYRIGKTVKRNYFKAVEYYKKACNLSANGYHCSKIANMYEHIGNEYNKGKMTKQKYHRAAEYYDKACKLNDYTSCLKLSFLHLVN